MPVALVGIGKTALALTFAFREAGAFPGGCWLIRCEGRASLAAIASLVLDLDLTGTRPPRPRQLRNSQIHTAPRTCIAPGCYSGIISRSSN